MLTDVTADQAPDSGHRRVVLRGFAVLGRGVAEQKWAFTIAVLGSTLWALMTVAQAYVLGRITENTVLPAFQTGQVVWGSLLAAALLVMAVAALKALGIAGRRIYAGRVQYELGASYRRRIAARYLALAAALASGASHRPAAVGGQLRRRADLGADGAASRWPPAWSSCCWSRSACWSRPTRCWRSSAA